MATTYSCPSCQKQSTDPDYCSECGAQISAAPANPASSPAAGSGHEKCPDCQTERDEGPSGPVRFCGVCRYDFVDRKSGGVVVDDDNKAPAAPVTTPASTPASTPHAVASASSIQSGPHVEISVSVNKAVAGAPKGELASNFSLFEEESLIGRANSSVHQQVSIEDAAVSKRHLLVVRRPDGSYVVRDLNSSNGSKVNGQPISPGSDCPVKAGDTINIGEFTVITVAAISQS